MNRLTDLARTHSTAPTPKATPAPKGYAPGIEYENGRPAYINTPPAPPADTPDDYQKILDSFGWPLPDGARLELVSAAYDPAAWHRDQPWSDDPDAPYRKAPAVTRPVWRYRLAVKYDQPGVTPEDRAALVKMAERGKGKKPPTPPKVDAAYVVAICDPQIGKAGEGADGDQGSEGTVQRLLDTLEVIAHDIRKTRPSQIVLLDGGDQVENCQNTSTQVRTNDLDLTEQMRVWRRILMRYVIRLSGLSPKLTVATVPSNHGQFRTAPKSPASGPWDDFGMDCMAAVQDAVTVALPGADIDFAYPRRGLESLVIDVAGTSIGLAHGHQAKSPDRVPDWIANQAAGKQPFEQAHVCVTAHFHHLRVQDIIGGRLWIQCPTIDPGSTWLTRAAGEWSAPGMLTFQTANNRVWDIRVN